MTFRERLAHAREIRRTSSIGLILCKRQAYAAEMHQVVALIVRELDRRRGNRTVEVTS